MSLTRKIALGIAAGALAVGSGLGVATMAGAVDPTPTPTPGQAQTWQRGGGFGRMADANAGLRNGAGVGAVAQSAYLADKLGVTEEAVTAAMLKYHNTHQATVRGRDLTEAQQTAAHESLAAFLATELKVSEAKVLDALASKSEVRQAERTATLEANLAEAVKAGRLTQTEADAIVKAHESGAMQGGMGMGGMGRGPRR